MAKEPTNHWKSGSDLDVWKLKQLVGGNTPTLVAALKLNQTAPAVGRKSSDLGISLKPTNQSPYGQH